MRKQSELQEFAVFARVVERKSFSAAAKSFDTTTSAISKCIARLEARLGVRVLARTTRRVTPTEVGTTLYASAVRILADVAEAEQAIARIGGVVRGTLRLSVPVMFGEHHVAPLVPVLLAKYPELRIDLSLSDRFVNLDEEGMDAAVRIGKLDDSSLVGVRIGEMDSAVCASPSYFEKKGKPQVPHDLAMHECLRYSLISTAREWRFRNQEGREFSVPVTGRLQVNHGAAMVRCILAGAGIARLPRFLVDENLARGELVEVLSEWRTKPSPVHVMHSSAIQTPPKVRAFIDMMRSSCGRKPLRRLA